MILYKKMKASKLDDFGPQTNRSRWVSVPEGFQHIAVVGIDCLTTLE